MHEALKVQLQAYTQNQILQLVLGLKIKNKPFPLQSKKNIMTSRNIVKDHLKKKKLDYYEQIGTKKSRVISSISNNISLPHLKSNQYDSSLNSLIGNSQLSPLKSKRDQNVSLNDFHVNWQNPKGYVCKKQITGESKCFCTHPLKYHEVKQAKRTITGQTAQPITHCTVLGCICRHYQYIPAYGTLDFTCICKHSNKDHDPRSKKCRKQRCIGCFQFNTSWTCDCGFRFNQHLTIIVLKKVAKIPIQKFGVTKKDGFNQSSIKHQRQIFESRIKQVNLIEQEEVRKAILIQQKKKQHLRKVNQKFSQNTSLALQMQYSADQGVFPYEKRYKKKSQILVDNEKSPFQLYLQQHHYELVKLSVLNNMKNCSCIR